MRFSFFGAAPDTGNLGVSALCYATIYNFLVEDPSIEFTIFDYGRGCSEQFVNLGKERPIRFQRQGAMLSRRYYRPENLRVMQFAGMFGGLGNPGIKTIRRSKAVFDISGGDSFTDLYGSRRFKAVILPKRIAIQQNIPLVLLPQTYGPFADSANEKRASEVVKKARCAWARDARSFDVLKELLGSSFDLKRHRCGVDVAFGLPTVKPAHLLEEMQRFFASDQDKVGINISGLIYNNFDKTKEQFGFKADYPKAVLDLIQRFLTETDCHIALISHVVAPQGSYESDLDACRSVLSKLDKKYKDRVMIMPEYDNPCEIKWVIRQLDWFCGTRMHATIAALSSGIPVATISYSPKALGVFETCGQGDHVADPRVMDNEELLDCLWRSWQGRENSKLQYGKYLPKVKLMVEKQVRSILHVVNGK